MEGRDDPRAGDHRRSFPRTSQGWTSYFPIRKAFHPHGGQPSRGVDRPIPARLLGHGKPVDALLDSAARNGLCPPSGSTGHRPLQGLPLPSHPLGLRLEIALRFPQPDLSGGGISRVSAEAWRMERLPPVGGVNVKRPTPSSAWGSGSMGVRQPGRSVGVAVAITRRYRNWSRLLRRPDFRHLPRHNGSLCLPPRLAHVITGRWIALG